MEPEELQFLNSLETQNFEFSLSQFQNYFQTENFEFQQNFEDLQSQNFFQTQNEFSLPKNFEFSQQNIEFPLQNIEELQFQDQASLQNFEPQLFVLS